MAENSPPILRHIEALTELVPPAGLRVVDVGCGDGGMVRALTRLGAIVTGIEIEAHQLAPALAATPAGNERYLEGRGEALPLEDESAELVLYFNSLHHVPAAQHRAGLEEARRVLVRGGAALIVEPLAEGDWFELVRPVEDETAVRAQAYAAIQAVLGDRFLGERELIYRSPLAFTGFDQAAARILAVDPARGPVLERLRPELAARFAQSGEKLPEGRLFYQPSRANLLLKRG
jgi:SAM-dependent methyltransferase